MDWFEASAFEEMISLPFNIQFQIRESSLTAIHLENEWQDNGLMRYTAKADFPRSLISAVSDFHSRSVHWSDFF
jgi:hypothetical protein